MVMSMAMVWTCQLKNSANGKEMSMELMDLMEQMETSMELMEQADIQNGPHLESIR